MPKKFALEMVMYTCPERAATRAATLASLGATDWRSDFSIVTDDNTSEPPGLRRQVRTFARAAHAAARSRADFVVVAEDDLRFNLHLEHNVNIGCLRLTPRQPNALSLYSSNIGSKIGSQAIVAEPWLWHHVHALLLQAGHSWSALLTDLWMRELVHVLTHSPSLVQHAPYLSTLKHPDHRALDFDPEWRARTPERA